MNLKKSIALFGLVICTTNLSVAGTVKNCAHAESWQRQYCNEIDRLINVAKTGKGDEQSAAVRMLGDLRYEAATSSLIEIFNKQSARDPGLAVAVVESIAKIGTDEGADFILDKVRQPLVSTSRDFRQEKAVEFVNRNINYQLLKMKNVKIISGIIPIINNEPNPHDDLLLALIANAPTVRDTKTLSLVLDLLKHQDSKTRYRALEVVQIAFRRSPNYIFGRSDIDLKEMRALTMPALEYAVSNNKNEQIRELAILLKNELALQSGKDQKVMIPLSSLYDLQTYVAQAEDDANDLEQDTSFVTAGDVEKFKSMSVVKDFGDNKYSNALKLRGHLSGNLEYILQQITNKAVRDSVGQ